MFRPPGFAEDANGFASYLGQRDELERWLAERGDTLTDTPADLACVDRAIDGWKEQPEIGPKLGNTVGLFLGSVLVRHVDGARWHVWPNGHPVVRLKSGHEYDVVPGRAAGSGRQATHSLDSDLREGPFGVAKEFHGRCLGADRTSDIRHVRQRATRADSGHLTDHRSLHD